MYDAVDLQTVVPTILQVVDSNRNTRRGMKSRAYTRPTTLAKGNRIY